MNDDLSSRYEKARLQRREKKNDGTETRITGRIYRWREPKISRGLLFALILLPLLVLVYPASSPFAFPSPAAGTAKVNPEVAPETRLWYIDNIGFERPVGRERVIITFSGKTVLGLPRPPLLAVEDRAESVLLKMEDAYVADHLRRPWGEAFAGNVTRVVPHQVTVDGAQWVHLVVDLKEKVPYAVRREGNRVLLEFNVAALMHKKTAMPTGPAVDQKRELTVARDVPGTPPRDVPPGAKAPLPPLISLDFQEANVKSVLRLLAEMGGVNIVSGDDVKGTVTIHLRNVTWEQALEVILDVEQLTYRRAADVITVMTVGRMQKEEAERAVMLEAKRLAELERKRLALEQERQRLALEQERHRLALEQERQRLALDKDRLDLEARAQAERDRPAEKVVKVVEPGAEVFVDSEIRQVLQLLAEERRRQGEKLSIVATDDVRGTVTADLRDVPWEQRFKTILDIRGLAMRRVGDVITVMTAERMRREEAERVTAEVSRRKTEQEFREREQKMAAELMKLEEARRKEALILARPPLITRVVPINYATPKLLQENLQELLLKDAQEGIPQGSIRVDGHTNSLIVQAVKEDMARMLALIAKLDMPVSQVSIRANIVETTMETARNLGIMWGGVYGTTVDGRSLFVTPGGTGATPTGQVMTGGYTPASAARGIGGHGFGVNFPGFPMPAAAGGTLGLIFGTIGGNLLELQLQALQKDGKLNIVSSPQISTLDNQMAFTEKGERVPYVTIDRDGRPEVRFHDAVLRLEITPTIIDDSSLKMKVVVKKDEVDTTRTVQGNPFIVSKKTETSLIVRDGETIVISGLSRQRERKTVQGVPWLQNIPGLGWLFKAEDKGDIMEEVVIFITPNVVRARVKTGIQAGS